MKSKIVFAGILILLLTGCGNIQDTDEIFETSNQDEVYEIVSEIRNDEREAHSEMLIFPEDEEDFEDAYLYEVNYGLSTAHQIVVERKYDREEFDSEIRRLLKLTYEGRHTYYTENQFNFPAIVGVFNHSNCYEYALLDNKKNQIVYVCNTFIDNMDFIKEDYRPVHLKELNKDNTTDYSIYYCSK